MKKKLYLSFFLLLVIPALGFSQSLSFSSPRGFYDSPFQLTITSSLAGGSIRYTTDGSAPSPTSGTVYSGPISVNTSRVIRAIGYSGTSVTPVTTHTYLFLDGVIRQPANISGWPNNRYALGSGGATAVHDYEMDPDVVNHAAYSGVIQQGLKAIPTMSLVLDKEEFWDLYEGDATFPTSVEIFYPDGSREQFDCGLTSHSHNRLKRSLKLDIDKSVTSELFRKTPFNGPTTVNKFKNTKIVLRGGNNRSWARNWNPDRTAYTRDEWYRISQQAISGTGGRGTFVHLYVNGLYWGLYNPVERTDHGMLSENFGGSKDDWMALDHDGIRHGDATRYNYLINTLVKKDLSNAANYQEFRQYLDVEKFSDYLIVSWMMGMSDWPTNNYHGGMRNVPAGPFFYNAWDAEWSFDGPNDGVAPNNGAWVHPQFRTSSSGGSTIASLWHAARKNKDFMQTFADRVYRHCFNNGPLTDAASRQRWAQVNDFIKTAIVAESARWGDAVGDGVTRTRDSHWAPEVKRVDGLMNGNVDRFIDALQDQGYYPSLDPPTLSKEGGAVAPGYQLALSNPNSGGTIYYTTDGSDPQLTGGTLSPAARAYSGPIAINGSLTLKTRVREGSSWSALHQAAFTLSAPLSGLYINEFLATNTREPDEFGELEDWVEIYNANAVPVNIAGLYITDNLSNPTLWQIPATHPALTTIPAKGFLRLWADNQPAQGPLHVNLKLGAGGEQLGLAQMVDGQVKVLDSFTFGAQTADVSSGRSPDGTGTFRSFTLPTPGSTNVTTLKTNLFINEVLALNQASITDEAGERSGWIEIYNQNTEPVDIGGLYLSNNPSNPTLWQIPATHPALTTIPAKGYLALWADNQPGQGALHLGFSLQAAGGQLALSQRSGTEVVAVDAAAYGSQQADVSWGRYPDAGKQARLFTQPTPKAANNLPRLSQVFINEFMATNKVLADPLGEFDDWIEIYNGGTGPVDIGGLFITDDLSNPGKYQIPTTDPAATTIPAKGFLLLWADEQPSQGVSHVDIKLGAGGEQIGLFQPMGTDLVAIDTLSFGAQQADISTGRQSNGGAVFVSFTSATPGASNNGLNSLPQAQAGPDQTIVLPVSTVKLAGAGTDADGSISAYTWSQVSGPGTATFSSGSVADPSVSGLVAGTYVFRLTVTDHQGATAFDEVTVTVDSVPVSGPQVLSFTLVNASTDQDIRILANGETIDLSALATQHLNIRANTSPATVGSVKFALSGAQIKNATESGAPYALYGDFNGDYSSWVPAEGHFTLQATPYSGAGGSGTAGAALTITFQVVQESAANLAPVAAAGADQSISLPLNSVTLSGSGSDSDGSIASYSWSQQSGPATATLTGAGTASLTAGDLVAGAYVFRLTVTDHQGATAFDEVTVTVNSAPVSGPQVLSFTLVNASTDQDIRTLANGETIDLSALATQHLNIRANTSPATVGSVKLSLSGIGYKTVIESGAPYALFGDSNGNYYDWNPAPGRYQLTATPYSGAGGSGTAGAEMSITFQVVDQAGAARLAVSSREPQPQGRLLPYPNPTADGRFQVLLAEAIAGEVAYELVSVAGATLAKGTLPLEQGQAVLAFDFSSQMQAPGMYYLKLNGNKLNSQLKVLRR